jgi:arylsulfatase A-like enzyme
MFRSLPLTFSKAALLASDKSSKAPALPLNNYYYYSNNECRGRSKKNREYSLKKNTGIYMAAALSGALVFSVSCTSVAETTEARLQAPEIEEKMAPGISGVVVGPAGTALANATVVLQDTFLATTTDSNGEFSFEGLPDSEYLIVVSSTGMKTQIFDVALQDNKSQPIEANLELNTYFHKAAADFEKLVPERLAQKQAYLDLVSEKELENAPNIVVIFFDDLGYGDLGVYGNKLIKTPKMDQLAAEGVMMTEFYSASPVCTPSRAALLTGRYPARSHAANHVFFPSTNPVATIRKALNFQNALPQDEILISEVLQQSGYKTALIGKWHLGDEPGHLPNDFGFDLFYGALYSNDMNPFAIYRDRDIEIEADAVDQGTLTQNYSDEAIAFMETGADQPFFLYFAHTFPHVPHYASAEFAGQSDAGLYGDIVEDLDRSVGAIAEAVKSLPGDRETLIIVTSDNGGDYLGSVGNLRGRKTDVYEGGMRVPMIAWWPERLPAGEVRDGMSMNIDLLPTILAELGLPLPEDRIIDGKNVLPLIAGDAETPHEYLYYTTAWNADIVGVRNDQHKFLDRMAKRSVNWLYPYPPIFTSFADPMLTDLGSDFEAHNLIDKLPDVANELRGALNAHRKSLDENLRGWTDSADQN